VPQYLILRAASVGLLLAFNLCSFISQTTWRAYSSWVCACVYVSIVHSSFTNKNIFHEIVSICDRNIYPLWHKYGHNYD